MSTITEKYNKIVEGAKFSYFALISMTILIGSCFGGVAAMYILKNDAPIWVLGINIGISMANNIAAIGQAPAKWVINLFAASIILNALMIAISVL